jgi:hypothetical protein
MATQLKILAATVLFVGTFCANAAVPPPAGGGSIFRLPSSTSPGQNALTPSPDGNAHVTMKINVNLTKLNPLATKAALSCHGIVDDAQVLISNVNKIMSNIPASSTTTSTANIPANSVPTALFDAIVQAYPNAQAQTVVITLASGSYQGTQSVSFTFTPSQLVGLPTPAFLGLCGLVLGDGINMNPAELDSAGDIQVPSSSNRQLVMTGQVNLVVLQLLQFAPL